MGAPSLDNEFAQYWLKLSWREKESLLSVAKHYFEHKKDAERTNIDQYNEEIDAAMSRMDSGHFLTHDQAVEASKSWVNGK